MGGASGNQGQYQKFSGSAMTLTTRAQNKGTMVQNMPKISEKINFSPSNKGRIAT